MTRLSRVLVVVALVLGLATQGASATSQRHLSQGLDGFWTFALQTPAPQNPFTSDNNRCHYLGNQLLAPMQPFAPTSTTCTVKPGTRVFVGEMSAECSTAEPPPFHGDNAAELRACVRSVFFGPVGFVTAHTLVLDGRTVPVTFVQTPLMSVTLPPDNMFGVPPQDALSVAMGWVALLHPMTPGVHHVTFTFNITFEGSPIGETNDITIIVTPGA